MLTMKRITALILSLLIAALCAACAPKEQLTVNVAAMKGPTGIGMAQLSSLAEEGKTAYNYSIAYAGSPDEVTGSLISGELDIAAVPVNLGAVLFNKTEGQILTAAVNTLGVLYVVEKGDSIQSVADLAGKKLLAAGQGSTPEYILNYILDKNGLAGSVEVEYSAEHAEAVTKLASGEADMIAVPEPFVTTALSKVEGARIALDLTAEWERVSDAQLVQGCLVVRKAFAEEHPEALKSFLREYAASAKYAVDSPAEAGALVEKYGIMASAALAEKAIPNCNIVCITGEEMQVMVSGMLKVLFDANPKSVGGKLPGDDMFYMG